MGPASRAVSPAKISPKASGRKSAPAPSQSRAHDSASARKSLLRAGSGSCSRAAQYEGRQDKGSSPGKRAMPELASATPAQQRATPAKRPKREARTVVEEQQQNTHAGSVPGVRHAAAAFASQGKQQGQLEAQAAEMPSLASRRTLQPSDVAHLQSAQNVRNSQDTRQEEPGNHAHPSGMLGQLHVWLHSASVPDMGSI